MLKGARHCLSRGCSSSNESPIHACETKEYVKYEILDEESKRGSCLSELRRAGMTRWICEQQEEKKPVISSSILDIEQEAAITQDNRKRKRLVVEEARRGKQRSSCKNTVRKQIRNDRWSAERYALAEKSMLEILKAEGAVFGSPITRPALRVAARERIGDTGLLDHLLKHIDGKVAPGGSERFRRWHNTRGIMEYWLESASLVDIRQQAGVQDPFWIPSPSVNPSHKDPVHDELKLLQAEMAKMKNDMQEFSSWKQEQDQAKRIEELREELVKWKAEVEQYKIGVSKSLSGIQFIRSANKRQVQALFCNHQGWWLQVAKNEYLGDGYKELVAWKIRTEQKLVEISNTLSSMQASKQSNALSPLASERWEDWLEGTNLGNAPEDDLEPWLESTNLVNEAAVEGTTCLALGPLVKADDGSSQTFASAKQLELLEEEMAKMKRDVERLAPKKQDEDQTNLTPDSSAMTTSKLDLDHPFLLFQEMCNELVNWKANMEQQLMEMARGMQASNQVGHMFKLSSFERWK